MPSDAEIDREPYKFPGVPGKITVGLLSGDLRISEEQTENCFELEVYSTTPLTVEDAGRFDGVIKPM